MIGMVVSYHTSIFFGHTQDMISGHFAWEFQFGVQPAYVGAIRRFLRILFRSKNRISGSSDGEDDEIKHVDSDGLDD